MTFRNLTRSFPAGAGLLLAACATVPSGMASSDAPAIAPVLDRPDAVEVHRWTRCATVLRPAGRES